VTRVGFILRPGKAQAGNILASLCPWLLAEGHEVVVLDEDLVAPAGASIVPPDEFEDSIDLAVVLGGDGTMLRANALIGDSGTPIMGINLGRLGFLTAFDAEGARGNLQRVLAGELELSERMRLSVTFTPAAGPPKTRSALNDVVINQGAMARLIDLEARLDDRLITNYRVDGLIVASPTGSTAYNLAAGGPIVYPSHEGMTLTPICAHGLSLRPLVLPRKGRISLRLVSDTLAVVLTIDGQWAHSFQPGDSVEITAADTPLRVYTGDQEYFDVLRSKLHWGEGPNG